MSFVSLVLVALATARLTRLITTDAVTAPIRKRVTDRLGPASSLVYLIHCDWCTSMYVAAGTVTATALGPNWIQWVLVALSASYVSGWLASRMED